MWSLRTVFLQFDGLSHVLSSELREVPTTSSSVFMSEPKNLFSNFCCIFEIHIKFYPFWKNRSASYLNYLLRYWLRRMWLLERSKGLVSEHSSAVNVLSDSKCHWNQNSNIFILPLFYSQKNWVGKHLSSHIWTLRTVFQYFEALWHVLSSELREIVVTSLNGSISETKNLFSNSFCIFETEGNFRAFWKKRSPS